MEEAHPQFLRGQAGIGTAARMHARLHAFCQSDVLVNYLSGQFAVSFIAGLWSRINCPAWRGMRSLRVSWPILLLRAACAPPVQNRSTLPPRRVASNRHDRWFLTAMRNKPDKTVAEAGVTGPEGIFGHETAWSQSVLRAALAGTGRNSRRDAGQPVSAAVVERPSPVVADRVVDIDIYARPGQAEGFHEQWLKRIPDFRVADDADTRCSGGLVAQINRLVLEWDRA